MSSGVLLRVVVVVAFFAATTSAALADLDPQLPIQRGNDDGDSWPCCDSCGICTKSLPPICRCNDLVRACHPSCKECVMSPVEILPPRYQCKDFIVNFCEQKCTPEPDTLNVA